MGLIPGGIDQIEKLRPVRTQPRKGSRFLTPYQQFRNGAVDGLAVDVKSAGPVGSENHRFAVGSPIERKVLPVIKGQSLWLTDSRPVLFEFGDIHVGLWNSFKAR